VGVTMNRHTDRRRSDRRPADSQLGRLTMALRTGTRVDVIDLSADGALVEASVRLEPGTNLAIRAFSTRTGVVHRATVIHCRVWSVEIGSGIRFRAGFRFEPCSGYPPNQPTRAYGNALPNHPRYQPVSWATRGRFSREHRAGAQVV
jgi:hypothetical protein